MKPSYVKNSLLSVIEEARANSSEYVNNPGRDMTRSRKCDFKDTILTILHFSSYAVNRELSSFFGLIPEKLPSGSAFSQQRNKYNEKLFPYLFSSFNAKFPFTKTYRDLHLLACDGTDLNLPTCSSDQKYFVRFARSDGGYYQAHINAFFDLCEGRYTDFVIQPRPDMDERAAFCEMAKRCPMDKTLFIADRGYPSLNVIAHMFSKSSYFLFRIKDPLKDHTMFRYVIPEDEKQKGEFDIDVCIGVTRSNKNQYKKHPERYKIARKNRRFDFIDPDNKTTVLDCSFWIVSILIPGTGYEYLITNLPRDTFPSKEIQKLYGMRWGIETSFRSLKYAVDLSHLHSVKRSLIIQEIIAKFIMYNLTALLIACGAAKLKLNSKNKWRYKISFADAASVSRFVLKESPPDKTIIALLLRHLTQIKPDQHHPRNVQSQQVRHLNNRA